MSHVADVSSMNDSNGIPEAIEEELTERLPSRERWTSAEMVELVRRSFGGELVVVNRAHAAWKGRR